MITEIFRDRDWNGDDAPRIEMFVSRARELWDAAPNSAPCEIIKVPRLRSAFGASITTKDFQDARLRIALEQKVLEALLWGLANPDRFVEWYDVAVKSQHSSLELMRKSGLATDAPPALADFLDQSETIVRDYEREVSVLPAVPRKLLSDAKALGVNVASQ